MSKSNTHYYDICDGPFDEDGLCERHSGWKFRGPQRRCIPAGEFETCHGTVKRRKRFPDWCWKSWVSGPPKEIKQIWKRRIRAIYTQEMRRHPYDPDLIDGERLLAGWYAYWA
jgi:hypothetical protein